MKTFAHWKNIMASRGVVTGPNGEHQRDVIELQTGPEHGPIQFIVDIPEETKRDDVVAKYVAKLFQSGGRIDEETEEIGFEEEWPPDVRSSFDSGSGDRCSWLSLK